jgi:hypothetical protein
MKIFKTLIVVIILFSFNSISFAEDQRDCSAIDTSTGVGMWQKYKCDKGLPEGEKGSFKKKLKKLNPFKKKN